MYYMASVKEINDAREFVLPYYGECRILYYFVLYTAQVKIAEPVIIKGWHVDY